MRCSVDSLLSILYLFRIVSFCLSKSTPSTSICFDKKTLVFFSWRNYWSIQYRIMYKPHWWMNSGLYVCEKILNSNSIVTWIWTDSRNQQKNYKAIPILASIYLCKNWTIWWTFNCPISWLKSIYHPKVCNVCMFAWMNVWACIVSMPV